MKMLNRFAMLVALVGALFAGSAQAQPLPGLGGGASDFDFETPDFSDPSPGVAPEIDASRDAEEVAPPAIDDEELPPAADPGEEESSRLVEYNAAQTPWLPIRGDEPYGWLEELQVPAECLDCTCEGKSLGESCRVWRSFEKPTHPAIDKDCVVCIKEPCLGYVKEHYTTDAVVQKCFVSEKCFTEKECADGRCIETTGTKTVKQLHPCKAKVKLYYWKPVVEYRDVYYYINCEPCNDEDQAVAMKGKKNAA